MALFADACVVLLISALLGQAQATTSMPAAPRDSPALGKGTASIKGKVVAAAGGRALRRVQISLASPDLGESKSVRTNSEGRFARVRDDVTSERGAGSGDEQDAREILSRNADNGAGPLPPAVPHRRQGEATVCTRPAARCES